MCDSDDDCEGLLRKALDVELPENFNPNSVPQTGIKQSRLQFFPINNSLY